MPLSADRKTDRLLGPEYRRVFPVLGGSLIYSGALVALDTNGYLVPGTVATDISSVGVSLEHVDNTLGLDGDLLCEVSTIAAKFLNSAGGDAIGIDDVGLPCYFIDDETVAVSDGGATRSVAGTVHQVDDDGVWVRPTGF